MNSQIIDLKNRINDFRRKFYQNKLIKGSLISIALILAVFLFVNFLEFFGRFSSPVRVILLLIFFGVTLFTLAQYIFIPIFYLFQIKKPLSDEEVAQQIGDFFPTIKDKLLNTLQLANISTSQGSLIEASINQKTSELKLVKFVEAINFGENKKYIKYVLPLALAALLLSLIIPRFYNSTSRIVRFNEQFEDPAPFEFIYQNNNQPAIQNEDFEINLKLKGESLPEEVYLVSNGRRYKMAETEKNSYNYTFKKIQESNSFYFTAGGFNSSSHKIKLVSRPALYSFSVALKYPAYLGKTPEDFDNVGNLVVPEGTEIKWLFKTQNTEKMEIVFDETERVDLKKGLLTDYNFQKKIIRNTQYSIQLENEFSTNLDSIHYFINVIPDQYPELKFEQIRDSSLYNYIGMGGTIADDYGITDFRFSFRKNGEKEFKTIPIPFNQNSLSQTFFYQVDIEKLGLQKNDQLEYYLIVTDNDGVNGRKSTKSSLFTFNMPTDKEYDVEVDKEVDKTQDKFEELFKKTKEFKKDLENLENTLKKKREMDFQDKKEIERLLNEKEELNKDINNLKEQLQNLLEKQNRFDMQNPEKQEKMQKLQEMLEDLMKNEDSKVLEELKKMLEEQIDDKSLNELNKFNKSQRNLDKDLDRTLNLFKEMQRKQRIENIVKDLNQLAEEQDKLADQTATEKNDNNNDLNNQQKQLNEKFDEINKKIDEVKKISEENNKDFDSKKEDRNDISQEMEKSSSDLKNQKNKSAEQSQKNASKKMKKMADDMQQQMQSAQMQQMQEDYNALRMILENLIKVSHDQEKVMKSFRNLSVSDPRFVGLSQDQLNISNDTKIIEDSLYSLAGRMMQLEAAITKEVTDMKNSIDESVTLIRERKLPLASSKQQYSMTSMNNLALMLSDVFNQMQQMMMPSGGQGGNGENNMGGKQQEINERLEGIGSGGKTPREISEELSDLINEQSKLRNQLKQLEERLNGTEMGKNLGDEVKKLQEEMDKSETDMANKRINNQLKQRQKNIETRLLDLDKALKEQELDPIRKSKTAINFKRTSPPELEQFKKDKQKQVELLRTTPPNFTPFYKNQTDNYFKKIN